MQRAELVCDQGTEGRIRKARIFFDDVQACRRVNRVASQPELRSIQPSDLSSSDYKSLIEDSNLADQADLYHAHTSTDIYPVLPPSPAASIRNFRLGSYYDEDHEQIAIKEEDKEALDELENNLLSATQAVLALAAFRGMGYN